MVSLPFNTWQYEEQTKAKHQVLNDYLDKWIKIVGKYNSLNYIDGFGGIGAYKDSSGKVHYGSPILVAQKIEQATKKLGREVNLIIIDENQSNLENINAIFDYLKLSIKPILVNNDFDYTINKLIDKFPNISPTFVFIDPFGFSLNIETLERLMRINKSEILLNFMFNGINRFLSEPKIKETFDQLFGSPDWRELIVLKGKKREIAIVELYRKRLKSFSRFVYYYRIEFPQRRRTYYYLFHLTNYFKGCSIMKSSFAKYNFGKVEYKGSRNNELTLFDLPEVRIKQAHGHLLSIYRNQQRTFQQIIEELIDSTEFLEPEFRRAVKDLEEENLVIVKRVPKITKTGRIRRAIDYNATIRFK